jgi:hypothetical protein
MNYATIKKPPRTLRDGFKMNYSNKIGSYEAFLMAACADDNRAIGTLNGEQLT